MDPVVTETLDGEFHDEGNPSALLTSPFLGSGFLADTSAPPTPHEVPVTGLVSPFTEALAAGGPIRAASPPDQRGGRSWAVRLMRLRRHSLISTQGVHTLNKPDGPRSAPATLAFHPPTAPAVRPRTKYRCSETNTSTGTAMVMIAPPVTTCQP